MSAPQITVLPQGHIIELTAKYTPLYHINTDEHITMDTQDLLNLNCYVLFWLITI